MTQSLSATVASEVRAEMARQGVSHRALAEHLGLPQTSVTKRLNGKIEFDISELERTAQFLGVPVTNFLTSPERSPAATSTPPAPGTPAPSGPPSGPTGPTPTGPGRAAA
jgi:transcriptional regulator with XRE-family HTH domain